MTSATETSIRPRGEDVCAPGRAYIPALDGLRAVSISLVLVGHLILSGQSLTALRPHYHAFGAVGVSVFFVISGYLITSLLLREEEKYGKISFKYFYIRRALRLLPGFYFYLGVVFLIWSAGLLPAHPWHSFVSSLFYVRNYVGRGFETDHIWSLSIEEQFYLFWPLLFVATARWRGRVTCLLVAAVCAWRSVLVFFSRVTEGPLYIRTDLRIDTILVGCLLAFALRSDGFAVAKRLFAKGWVAISATSALLVWNGWLAKRIPYSGALDTTVTSVLLCAVLYWLLANPDSAASGLLQRRGVVYVGRLSYSLYLWQQLFLAAPTSTLAAVRWFPASLFLAVGAALLSYHGLERPFLRVKDRCFARS